MINEWRFLVIFLNGSFGAITIRLMKLTFATPALSAMFLFCGSILGQGPAARATPDFNGRWRTEKVQETIAPGLPSTKKRDSVTGWEEIVIIQKGAVVVKKMSATYQGKPYTLERTYYTDERGETNPIEDDPKASVVSKTRLKKDVLVTEGFISGVDAGKNTTIVIRLEIRLSNSGKNLKVKECLYARSKNLPFDPGVLPQTPPPCSDSTFVRIQ